MTSTPTIARSTPLSCGGIPTRSRNRDHRRCRRLARVLRFVEGWGQTCGLAPNREPERPKTSQGGLYNPEEHRKRRSSLLNTRTELPKDETSRRYGPGNIQNANGRTGTTDRNVRTRAKSARTAARTSKTPDETPVQRQDFRNYAPDTRDNRQGPPKRQTTHRIDGEDSKNGGRAAIHLKESQKRWASALSARWGRWVGVNRRACGDSGEGIPKHDGYKVFAVDASGTYSKMA